MNSVLDHVFTEATFMSKITWNLRPADKKTQTKREERAIQQRMDKQGSKIYS